jgi:two-component system sensor histidine kinase KdpD
VHAKRFQDVLQILEAEIDVLSTLNIQHVESITPRVQSLTGITVRETVPDWVLDRADEVVLSDLTPEALVHRMSRGDIYPQERVERALQNFFRRGNLIALREMALQRVTRAVDRTLDDYVTRKKLSGHWQIAERIAVCISANPESRDLIARGARMAEAMNGEFFVLYVDDEEDADGKPEAIAGGEYPVCRECGREGGPAEGQERAGHHGGLYIEEQDYAGDLRAECGEGLETVLVLSCAGEVYVECSARGCAHCDADGEVRGTGARC